MVISLDLMLLDDVWCSYSTQFNALILCGVKDGIDRQRPKNKWILCTHLPKESEVDDISAEIITFRPMEMLRASSQKEPGLDSGPDAA